MTVNPVSTITDTAVVDAPCTPFSLPTVAKAFEALDAAFGAQLSSLVDRITLWAGWLAAKIVMVVKRWLGLESEEIAKDRLNALLDSKQASDLDILKATVAVAKYLPREYHYFQPLEAALISPHMDCFVQVANAQTKAERLKVLELPASFLHQIATLPVLIQQTEDKSLRCAVARINEMAITGLAEEMTDLEVLASL